MEPDVANADVLRFTSVDELDEAVRRLGFNLEYRQLGRGAFSAALATLEGKGISLASERFDNHLDIFNEPPEGYVGIYFGRFHEARAACGSREISQSDVVVLPAGSELEIVTRGTMHNDTLFMAQEDFLAAARTLTPGARLLAPRLAVVHAGDPVRLAAIRDQMDAAKRDGALGVEAASQILTSTILWLADSAGESNAEHPANGVATAIAARARSYIEEHFNQPIRMEDLCATCGVGVRTLQRCFASQYQLSASEYIKARRLNAARRDLSAAAPESDSVTGIALANGFTHLGRFSVAYREHFCESPRDTLAAAAA